MRVSIANAARLARNVHRVPEIVTAHRQAEDALGLSLRYTGMSSQPYPYEVTLRSGVRFCVNTREELKVFWNIFCRPTYHVDPRDEVIIDAGANIGLFAVWAARIAPGARILSLEPWPSTFERLISHIELNALADRVQPANFALAGESGWRSLVARGDSSTNRIELDQDRTLLDASSESSASCLTLAAAFEAFEIGAVDLLKMDIEGSEYETLLATPHSILHRIARIDLEYHEVPAHLGYSRAQLFAHLRDAGHVPVSVSEDEFRTGVAHFRRVGR